MKIDPTLTLDLFERLREAAETAASGPSTSVDATSSMEALPGAKAGLETNLRSIARRALSGEFADAAAVRTEVVQQILTDRWRGRVEAAKLDEMLAELTPTLVEDPEFRRQVDEMLVLAAREGGAP